MLNVHFYLTKIENPFQINPNYSRICVFIFNLVPRALFPAGKIKRTGDEAYMFVRYKENEKIFRPTWQIVFFTCR